MKLRTGRPNESSTILVARAAPSVATPGLGPGRLEGGEKLLHALEAALDLFFRGRIRDADMLATAECLSRDGDYVRLMQQAMGNVTSRIHAATAEKMRDVGICVEGAFRPGAGDAGDGGEPGYDA